MAKRVDLTESIKEKIRSKCGDSVDFNQIVVYQARGISTEPISQNTIYDKGVLSREALQDMVNLINDPLNNVTIQAMHDQDVLPHGRVIHAELVDENPSVSAVYALFVVSTEHPDVINKIDNGIIDEVSFSFLPKKILCSKCGYDFRDPNTDFFDVMTGHCPECDSIMGRDGVHVNVPNIESVSELSLVTRGAARHAKILDSVYQMAMSDKTSPVISLNKEGLRQDLLQLNLCSTINDKEVDMNKEELEAAVLAATSPLTEEVNKMQSTLASLGEEKKALEAAKEEAEQAKAALEQENASLSEEKANLETALEEAKAKAEEIQSKFDAEVQKVLVAAGLSDSVPAELEAKLELLNKSRLTLANIPTDGVAAKADQLKGKSASADFSVYKVNKEK